MKKLIACLLALASLTAQAITYTPISTLNPTGSTSGQFIGSTGPSTAPAWTTVTLSGVSGTLPIANGGTGATTAAAALAALGAGATASPLSQFAATTSAQLAGIISNETGSGLLVFGTSPTITTPNIVGTTTNNNASAGSVGEVPTPTNLTGVSLTNGTGANVSSVSLTAGDYDVSCLVQYTPASTTVVGSMAAGINTTSATLGALGTYTLLSTYASGASGGNGSLVPSPVVRESLASTTTVFCVGYSGFTTSTETAGGYMHIRRLR
jgi:hypothetical protein